MSANQLSHTDDIKIYPQPARTHAIIEFVDLKNIQDREFLIHNIVGEIFYTGITQEDNNVIINTNAWQAGVYYLLIKMENKNLTHRFVVE